MHAIRDTLSPCFSQKDVALEKKSSTIEAKIQAFIPGKLVVVSTQSVILQGYISRWGPRKAVLWYSLLASKPRGRTCRVWGDPTWIRASAFA